MSILAKATYSIAHGETAVLTGPPMPFYEADQFLGGEDPLICPPLHESDLVPWKPRTDVIIHGNAHAPRGKRARFFDAGVSVGGQVRKLRVFGNRTVDASGIFLKFTEPELFEEMPLHFGLAYGGTDTLSQSDSPLYYPRNPVGKGFVIDAPREKLHGMVLPNLEDPLNLLTPGDLQIKSYDHWRKAPEPRAFGFLPRHAHSRMACMQRGDMGGANQGAAPWMQFPRLKGDETIALGYMDPDFPHFEFRLPGGGLAVKYAYGSTIQERELLLQGIEVFMEAHSMSLLWGISLSIPPYVMEAPDWKYMVGRSSHG